MNRQDRIRRRQTAQAEATRPMGETVPWCEPCRSFHQLPRDVAHHAALKCKAAPPLPVAEATPPPPPRGKGPSPEVRDEKMKRKGRLPNGSVVSAIYAEESWWAEIVLPIRSGDEWLKFEGRGPGLFKLLSELDDQYRASLKGGGT